MILCHIIFLNKTITMGMLRPEEGRAPWERPGQYAECEEEEILLKLKKLVSTLLALTLMIGMLPTMARAAGDPTISVTSGEVKAGEEITLTVSIADNPGLAACKIYFYFDTSVFSIDTTKGIKGLGEFAKSGGVIGNTIETAKANDRYDGAGNKDGVLVLWYNGTGTNTDANGDMLKLTLSVLSGVPSGDYRFEVGYSNNDTCNEDGENVSLVTNSGIITVTGGNGTKTEEEEPAEQVPAFSDVSGIWAESFINDAANRGLIQGYQGLYRPNDTMTRAEFVTILWRASGEPKPTKAASFTDLKQDWYKDAVAWAEENSVVNGMGDGTFDPTGSVTREQLVTILHRLTGTPTGMEAMFTGVYDSTFSDSGKIGSWAKAALYWSIYNEIFCGQQSVAIGNTLAPKEPANRAQIAVMITRYLDKQ